MIFKICATNGSKANPFNSVNNFLKIKSLVVSSTFAKISSIVLSSLSIAASPLLAEIFMNKN
ncbi:hypothetical protein LAD12857_00840 [Lacrimispora amygdalina]|uniref:Uncharacterized protein n=1 Tax=Lacrimispora amygdalina TaxID=253257 RepID=A0ABQ5LZJ3_9FIRM